MRPLPIVEQLDSLGLLRKWRSTLGMARRHRQQRSAQAWRVRLQAIGPIRRPVFILGCPRSGTTFLGSVLSTLPGCSYYFEPALLKYYSRLIYENRVSMEHARRVYHTVLRSLLWVAPGNGCRIIEKTPKHTWIAEALLRMFPDARFVFIHRDGRDVALSLLAKPWHRSDARGTDRREPGGYLYGPYPHFYIEPDRRHEYETTSDFHRAIWIWRRYAEEMLRLRAALPTATQFHVRYESLVTKPPEALLPLLAFLHETNQASREGVLQAATERHRLSVAKWKTQMDPSDLAIADQEAGDLLQLQCGT